MPAIRAVVVHRPTDYELLLQTHATRGQAEFFLKTRGQAMDEVEAEHAAIHRAIQTVLARIPPDWRRAAIPRAELARFLFEPEDVVVAVGQDGLVANVAKYLSGQLVIGLNPLPSRFPGVLVRHPLDAAGDLFSGVKNARSLNVESRTMARATLDDGQTLVALNEIFLGHRTHQSARYTIAQAGRSERQSSSGVIVCTGTGATGWASSIRLSRAEPVDLPRPTDRALGFFVREAWPSRATGTSLTQGVWRSDAALELTSEMNQGGVIFGDGIEDDFLEFGWGKVARVSVAEDMLRLVV